MKFPVLFQPLRCALTGAPGGADLFDTMALLGAGSVERRIRQLGPMLDCVALDQKG